MSESTGDEKAVLSSAVLQPDTVGAAAVEQQDPADRSEPQSNAATQPAPEASQENSAIDGSTKPIDAEEKVEGTAKEAQPSVPSSPHVDRLAIADEPTGAPHATTADEDTDFVPPDMEHIVSTGAAQDGASSMQALRELVAQARASSGQPREALPPGFSDEESEPSTPTPAQAQRGEKRKAEDELESLVRSSAGIDEVRAAAEKSQHPETKTLLQKALSSISGLVSRRGKAEATATAPSIPATSEENIAQDVVKPLVVGEAADDSDDSDASSSDSSDDEDEDDVEEANDVALAGDDDDDEAGGDSTAPATKNEILAPDFDQPAIQQVTEAEKQTLRKLGKVHSIVDSVVVVEQDVQQSQSTQSSSTNAAPASVPVDSTGRRGERQGEYSVLDTGSLLCFQDGKVLGLVFETFGSIHNPMYSIRFASAASIDRELIQMGKAVFYLPSQSTYVLTQLLRSIKGSDASNQWDEEVAEDEIDYSDDEQEAEAKRRAKATRYGKVDDQGNPLPAPARGNKRQKQQGTGQSSQTSFNPSSNGYAHQRPNQGGAGNVSHTADLQHPQQWPLSLPRRSGGGPDLPLPPIPSGPASLGPAFPHGLASLPLKPSAGLPSKPSFAPESPMSSHRHSSELTSDQQATTIGSRSRTATAESSIGGLPHSRMSSTAASSLPAKPVDALAAAAAAEALASGSTTPKQSTPAMSPHRAPAAGTGASPPPPHASRPALMRGAAPTPVPAYPHQGSPGWYAAAGSAPSSTPASPAAPPQHGGALRGILYSPGAGAPVAAQGGGHYNPAYAAHWQQHSYGPAATSAPPAHPSAGVHAWTAPYQHHSAPLHMAPGAISHQQPYGGYGGYGAPANASAPWAGGPAYPGSHYPGYTDRQYHASAANANAHAAAVAGYAGHNNYAPATPAHGYSGYPTQGANSDPYNGYVYAPPNAQAAPASNAAASSATPESYDPRSPLMGGNSGQNQHAASGSSQSR